jgi:ABC-type Mn2+/Zn2+ transport system permease subunit
MDLSFLSLGYMQNGLAAALLVGSSCAVTGVFIVLRQIVFVSMVLAQLAVLGLSAAMYLQLSEQMEFICAFASTIIGVIYLAIFQNERKAPPDALLGMGYAGCHALSLLMLAKSSQGLEEVRHLMSGNLLSVNSTEVKILAFTAIFMFIVHLFGHRSFVFICSDSEFAKVTGKQVKIWELLFFISLGLVISVALQMTGIFYVFSCLIFPGMVGLLLGSSFATIQIISIIFAIITGFLGVWVSFAFDFPTSEAIMSLQTLGYALILIGRRVFRKFLSLRRIKIYKRLLLKRKVSPAGGLR